MAGTEARPTGKELVGRPSLAATFLLVPKLLRGNQKRRESQGISLETGMAGAVHPKFRPAFTNTNLRSKR